MRMSLLRTVWIPVSVALAVTGTVLVATSAAQRVSHSPPGLAAAQPPEGTRLPAESIKNGLKLPAPNSDVIVVWRATNSRGQERILAAWRTSDGFDCVGWAEQEGGLPNICSDGSTQLGPSSFDFAQKLVGGSGRNATGQLIMGFAPAEATQIVMTADGGATTAVPTISDVAAARGSNVFAFLLPAAAPPGRLEAKDRDGKTITEKRTRDVRE